MKIFRKLTSTNNDNDASLVMNSLGGDRDAFCQIVSRYQNLLCALAYSSLGDLKHSEDLAQEVFVEAWQKLDTLIEPEKLKAWLCGILRFKISHYRRKENNQPLKNTQDLDEHTLNEPTDIALEEATIKQQQNSLLWKVLNDIDCIYREPLILFYREEQSIARVAKELDLTQDTVKQRLSRGRKLLKSALSTFVEDSLKNSKPGVTFTAIVMTAISGIAPPAKATLISVGAAKTGALFKLTTLLTFLAACSGMISAFFGLRASFDQTRTVRERRLVIKTVTLFMTFAGIFVAGMFILKYFAMPDTTINQIDLMAQAKWYAVTSQILVLIFVISYFLLICRMFKAMRNLRAHERIFEPQAFSRDIDQVNAKQREYKSKLTFLGIPLIHMQFAIPEVTDKPAFGWIAGGSYAYGLLFAWGGVAIAPISVGIVSLGVISIGAIGLGLLAMGTVAIGIIAFGASAVGYNAYASLSSLGWESAFSNGFSIAKEAAIGSFAYAEQINNELAASTINLTLLEQSAPWLLVAIAIFVIVPAIWHATKVKKRMR
ncbi:MAG: RNA polymerase sigma factor [Thalassotalea sp.]